MARKLLAFVGGLVTTFVVVFVMDLVQLLLFPEWFPSEPTERAHMGAFIWNIIFAFPAGFFGGFVAALISREDPLTPVYWIVGAFVVLNLLTIWYYQSQAHDIPLWYSLTVLVIGVVGLLAGGRFGSRRSDAINPDVVV